MTIRGRLLVGTFAILVVLGVAVLLSVIQLRALMRADAGDNAVTVVRSVLDRLERDVEGRFQIIQSIPHLATEVTQFLAASSPGLEAADQDGILEDEIARRDAAWRAFRRGEGETPPFVEAVSNNPGSQFLREMRGFSRASAGYDVFRELFLTDRFGVTVAQTGMTSDYLQSDESWWVAAFEHGFWAGPVAFDESSGGQALEVAVRVRDRDDRFIGVLKASIDLKEIHQALDRLQVSLADDVGSLTLIDAKGVQLYPRYLVPTEGAPPFVGLLDGLDEGYRVVDGEGGQGSVLEAWAGSQGLAGGTDLGWVLILRYPTSKVFATISSVQRGLATTTLIGIVVAVLLALALAFSIVRPLRAAISATRQLAQGDLDVAIDMRGAGETRQMLDAMKNMVTVIRRAIGHMVTTSRDVLVVAGQLEARGQAIAKGADLQSSASTDSAQAVEHMGASARRLRDSIDEVNQQVSITAASVGGVDQAARSVTETSGRQTAELVASAATLRKLRTSFDDVVSDARAVAASSSVAASDANSGGVAVEQTVTRMTDLATIMDQTLTAHEALATRGKRIDRISDVIEELAGQSRLLAFNATVQATKAGEHGRGFSIVAAEVQRLADRSAASAKEITTLVGDLHAGVAGATQTVRAAAAEARTARLAAGEAAQALERIVSTANTMRERMQGIAQVTASHAATVANVMSDYERLSQMADEVTAATTTQAARQAEIRAALRRLDAVTERVVPELERHQDDRGKVNEAIERIAAISTENARTAADIVAATEALRKDALLLREQASFFRLRREQRADSEPK